MRAFGNAMVRIGVTKRPSRSVVAAFMAGTVMVTVGLSAAGVASAS